MARRRSSSGGDQLSLLDARVTTAPAVPAIRKAVEEWRHDKYRGATETSQRLLTYWFNTDHRYGMGAVSRITQRSERPWRH